MEQKEKLFLEAFGAFGSYVLRWTPDRYCTAGHLFQFDDYFIDYTDYPSVGSIPSCSRHRMERPAMDC